jgi:broad specificity phosphatase PhoE
MLRQMQPNERGQASWLRRFLDDHGANKGPVQVLLVASGAIMRAWTTNARRVKQELGWLIRIGSGLVGLGLWGGSIGEG